MCELWNFIWNCKWKRFQISLLIALTGTDSFQLFTVQKEETESIFHYFQVTQIVRKEFFLLEAASIIMIYWNVFWEREMERIFYGVKHELCHEALTHLESKASHKKVQMAKGALFSIRQLNLSHEVQLIRRRRRRLSGGYSIKFYGHLIRKSAQSDIGRRNALDISSEGYLWDGRRSVM